MHKKFKQKIGKIQKDSLRGYAFNNFSINAKYNTLLGFTTQRGWDCNDNLKLF